MFFLLVLKQKVEEEMAKHRKKAAAMNAIVVRSDASVAEKDEAKRQAELNWAECNQAAAWGCAWYVAWLGRVMEAVEKKQRLKIVYFPGQVGKGKLTMEQLADADLWDGTGCGGSQKCEIATVDLMKQKCPGDQMGHTYTLIIPPQFREIKVHEP